MIIALLTGCASITHDEEKSRYRTLGIATVQECTKYEDREDNVVEQCVEIETDAFSGWEAIMTGFGRMIVTILTAGFK